MFESWKLGNSPLKTVDIDIVLPLCALSLLFLYISTIFEDSKFLTSGF